MVGDDGRQLSGEGRRRNDTPRRRGQPRARSGGMRPNDYGTAKNIFEISFVFSFTFLGTCPPWQSDSAAAAVGVAP